MVFLHFLCFFTDFFHFISFLVAICSNTPGGRKFFLCHRGPPWRDTGGRGGWGVSHMWAPIPFKNGFTSVLSVQSQEFRVLVFRVSASGSWCPDLGVQVTTNRFWRRLWHATSAHGSTTWCPEFPISNSISLRFTWREVLTKFCCSMEHQRRLQREYRMKASMIASIPVQCNYSHRA